MFNRKKPQGARSAAPTPRGRSAPEPAAAGANPLARRFRDSPEPDTADLAEPGRYHLPAAATPAEPDTRATTAAAGVPDTGDATRRPLITRDATTGKFHLHPGTGGDAVSLNGAAVDAPTELRPGDRLEVGGAGFEFLA